MFEHEKKNKEKLNARPDVDGSAHAHDAADFLCACRRDIQSFGRPYFAYGIDKQKQRRQRRRRRRRRRRNDNSNGAVYIYIK